MDTLRISKNLRLIDLKQDIRGFRKFIGSWVFTGDHTFLVDVGPSATASQLIEYLKSLNIGRLEYIFLTHIHLDHAGGIGELIEAFPEATVICHERAVKHLVNPKKLWEGTKKALGEIAIKYGEMKPVSREKIVSSGQFRKRGFQAISTPGHAVHHVSYVFGQYLFAGEVGGVFHSLDEGMYLRPATPPKFYFDEAVKSIDKLLNLGNKEMCLGHFGVHRNSKAVLAQHRKQLFLWKKVITDQMKRSANEEDLLENCISEFLAVDKSFMSFDHLDDDIKERERRFIKNSIDGYTGYINDAKS